MGRYSAHYDPASVRDLAYSILRDAGRHPTGNGVTVTDLCILLDWMHENIKYELDDSLYGQRDYIATPKETLKARRGDCEDHALLYGSMCLALGAKVRMALVPGHAFSEISLGPSSQFNGKAAVAEIRRFINKRSKSFGLASGKVPFSQGKLATGWTRDRSGNYSHNPRSWCTYSRKFHRVQWNVSDGEVYMPVDDCYCMMYPGNVKRLAEFRNPRSGSLWKKVDYEYPGEDAAPSRTATARVPTPKPAAPPESRPKRRATAVTPRPKPPRQQRGRTYMGQLIAFMGLLLAGGFYAGYFPLAVDGAVGCLVLWCMWRGFEVGLFEQGIKLASMVVPIAGAIWLLDRSDALYLEYVAVELPYRRAAIAFALFLVFALVLRQMVNAVADGKHSSAFDGLLGAFFGGAMGLVIVYGLITASLAYGDDLGWTPPYGDSIAAQYVKDYDVFQPSRVEQARDAFESLELTLP